LTCLDFWFFSSVNTDLLFIFYFYFQQWHPDRNHNNQEEATENFQKISQAFDALSGDENNPSDGHQPSPKRRKVGRRRGVLLLDITNPRVSADGNVFVKARLVQDGYDQTEGKKLVVIVIVGGGISTRHESGSDFIEEDKNKTISEVIQSIDDDERYGLDTPIFVFGFSKMTRGLSFRSARRVPTHVTASRGYGYAYEEVTQTLGRGTGCGMSVLQENGFEHVTVLSTSQDLALVKKYPNFTAWYNYRKDQGDSFMEVLTGANEKIPDSANYFKEGASRKVGAGPMHNGWGKRVMEEKGVLIQEVFTNATKSNPLTKAKYREDYEAQKLLGVISRIWEKNPMAFPLDDLREAYAEDKAVSIPKNKAKKLLERFCKDNILCRIKTEAGVFTWCVFNLAEFGGALNPDLSGNDTDQLLKSQYWNNEETQKLLGVISRLWKNRPIAFELRDMELAYFDDRLKVMKQREAKARLKELCACHLLQKDKSDAGAEVWSVLNESVFDGVLNPEFCGLVSSLNTRP
jgi:hypothetical protein